MKRLLIQSVKFLATTLALYLLVFFALTKLHFRGKPVIYRSSDYYQWKGGVAHAKFREWDAHRRWDAVVIGSSHAYRGYDPRVFAERGHAMFNLGSSAQTPLSSYVVLKHHVDSSNTRLVILDLYENAFDQDGNESVSDLTQNMSDHMAAAELAWDYRDLRGLNMFTLRVMNADGPPLYHDKDYKGRGFAIKSDSVKKDVKYDVGRPLRLNKRQLERFAEALDLCQERGLPVVLVTHFYPHQSDQRRHAAFKQAIDSLLVGRNIPWLDFAYAHDLNDSDHFCDHNHMNEAGARLFNQRFVDSLEARGFLARP